MDKIIKKSRIFKDTLKKASGNKKNVMDDIIEKNEETNYTKGKTDKQILEFKLKSVNQDIKNYNIDVINLLKIGMKKSQFTKFKVPKPKYNCTARDLKNVIDYDPKSYYYNMAVVLDCTFDNLQYSGGKGGGEVPYIDPATFTQIINQIFGTSARTDSLNALDGYLNDLRIIQNLIREGRTNVNAVRDRFTLYQRESNQLQDNTDIDTQDEIKGPRGEAQGRQQAPRTMFLKLFFSNAMINENPWGFPQELIDYIKKQNLTSENSVANLPNIPDTEIQNFINNILGMTVGQIPAYESHVDQYIEWYIKNKKGKRPSTVVLTNFMINYVKRLLGIPTATESAGGAYAADIEWMDKLFSDINNPNLSINNVRIVRDIFYQFINKYFYSDDSRTVRGQPFKIGGQPFQITAPERTQQNIDKYNVDKPTGEVALEIVRDSIEKQLNEEGIFLSIDDLNLINQNIIDLITIAQSAQLNTLDELLSQILDDIDKYIKNYTNKNRNDSKGLLYAIKKYLESKNFKMDVATFLKDILQGKQGITQGIIDNLNEILKDLNIQTIEKEPRKQYEYKQEEENKFDAQGNFVPPTNTPILQDRDEPAELGLNNIVGIEEESPELQEELDEDMGEVVEDMEGVDIDIENVPNEPPTQRDSTSSNDSISSNRSDDKKTKDEKLKLVNGFKKSMNLTDEQLELIMDNISLDTLYNMLRNPKNKNNNDLKKAILDIIGQYEEEKKIPDEEFNIPDELLPFEEDLQVLLDDNEEIKEIIQEIVINVPRQEQKIIDDLVNEALESQEQKYINELQKKRDTYQRNKKIKDLINKIKSKLPNITKKRLKLIINRFYAKYGIPTNIRPTTYTILDNNIFPEGVRNVPFNYNNLFNDLWNTYLFSENERYIGSLLGEPTNDYIAQLYLISQTLQDTLGLVDNGSDEELAQLYKQYVEWFNKYVFRYVGVRFNRIRERRPGYSLYDEKDPYDLIEDEEEGRYGYDNIRDINDPIELDIFDDPYDDDDPDDDPDDRGGDPGDIPPDDDPEDGPGYENDGYIRRRGFKLKNIIKLLIYSILAGVTGVGVDEIIKAIKAGEEAKSKDTPLDPKNPGDNKKPDDPKKPDDGTKFTKINHNDLFDSVGLGDVIDFYNNLVEDFNNNLTPTQRKEIYKKINDTYNKFAKVIGVPELKELQEARKNYDRLKYEFEKAKENGLSVSSLMAIYSEMQSSARNLDYLTDKYMGIENGIFKGAFGVKSKEDADVTIDDHDTDINLQTPNLKSKLDAKAKSIKGVLLSKGMQERIARKMNRQGDFSNELLAEQRRFNDFSIVQQYEYPIGLGLDNSLQRHNKQIEIIQYKNPNKNPKPYIVPNINKCIRKSKQQKPILRNVIMIDNEPDDIYYNPMDNKLHDPNMHTSNINQEFHKSSLYNPEYTLQQIFKNKKAKDTVRHDDWIRGGPYTYINPNRHNPAYQYGQIQQKYNDKLNNYPLTYEGSKLQKGIHIKKVNSTLIKKRKITNNYSLK